MLGDGTVLVATASVAKLLADAALEESLTSLTADHPIVATYKHTYIGMLLSYTCTPGLYNIINISLVFVSRFVACIVQEAVCLCQGSKVSTKRSLINVL